jgi:hypothetical protein
MRSNRGADDLGVETPPPLPFVVPWISAAVGMDRFFGSLPTSRLNKVMTASAIGRIVHTDPGVVVVRARLLPPSLNSSAILRGNGDYGDALSAGVQMATWTRRDLCQALRAAGFRVDERVTWFSLGGSLR